MSSAAIAPHEDEEQSALVQWCDLNTRRYPELVMLFAIPNGANKSPAARMRFKRTGLRSGVPDLCLPIARGEFHGLFIEMKRQRGGHTSLEQKLWIERLRAFGYRVEVAAGWEAARDVLLDYLKQP